MKIQTVTHTVTESNLRGETTCLSCISLTMIPCMHSISQPIGELVFVNVFMLGDVSESAVVPRAARRPPEKTLLLVHASTRGENVKSYKWFLSIQGGRADCSYPGRGQGSVAADLVAPSPGWVLNGYRTVSGAPSTTIP